MEENDIYSISAINNLIDKKISYCDDFKKIKIRGEITNFNGSYNSGHYYFSLKDKNSSISCVMFKLSTKSLDFEPKNGVDVVASGEVSFYKVRGNLQFRVRKMQEAGLGDLYIAFEKLKKKLDKEGLFKDKKVIPQYPKKIGVITSASGKAVKDIVNNIEKRWPAEIIVWNTTVQGANSTRSITKNIALTTKVDGYDENGKLPRLKKVLSVDALGPMIGSLLGTSPVVTYIESSTGIMEGGRTGLTAIVVGILFLLAIPFAPIFTIIPTFAVAPALVVVGILMCGLYKNLDTGNLSDLIPALAAIIVTPLTQSITTGIIAGVFAFVIVKVLFGKAKEISKAMWILFALLFIYMVLEFIM